MVDYSLLSRGLGVQSNLNNTQNWGGYGYLSLESGLNIGVLSYTGPDPLENHKATKPASMLGYLLSARQQSAI